MENKIDLLMFSDRFKKWYIRIYHVLSYIGIMLVLGGTLLVNRLLFSEELVDVFPMGIPIIIYLMLTVFVICTIFDTKNKDFDDPIEVQSIRIMYTRIIKMMSEWKRNVSSRFFLVLAGGKCFVTNAVSAKEYTLDFPLSSSISYVSRNYSNRNFSFRWCVE